MGEIRGHVMYITCCLSLICSLILRLLYTDKCDTLGNVKNGDTSLETDCVTTVSVFFCDRGYTISERNVGTCHEHYLLYHFICSFICQLLYTDKCDLLGNVKNGDISQETDGITTISVFSCDSGYTISGRDKATCRENGTWDTDKPECGKNTGGMIPKFF